MVITIMLVFHNQLNFSFIVASLNHIIASSHLYYILDINSSGCCNYSLPMRVFLQVITTTTNSNSSNNQVVSWYYCFSLYPFQSFLFPYQLSLLIPFLHSTTPLAASIIINYLILIHEGLSILIYRVVGDRPVLVGGIEDGLWKAVGWESGAEAGAGAGVGLGVNQRRIYLVGWEKYLGGWVKKVKFKNFLNCFPTNQY